VSPYGGLPAAIGNDLASAVSEGEARQNKPQTYSQIQHWEHQRLVKDQRRLGRQKIKIEALDLEHSMNYVHDLFLSVGVGVRALVEEAATLASLALFLGMIAIWAQVIATL